METIKKILSNATEEELDVLAEYYDAVFVGQHYKAKVNSIPEHQDKALQLILGMQRYAKSFFIRIMEYDEIVLNVAKLLDIEVQTDSLTDDVEIQIAKSFVISNYAYIPPEQQQDLAKVLGCASSAKELKEQIGQVLTGLSSLAEHLAFLEWLSNTALQTFLGKGNVWESSGFLDKLFHSLIFGGGAGFRTGLILPIIHISMLRHKQRYQTI